MCLSISISRPPFLILLSFNIKPKQASDQKEFINSGKISINDQFLSLFLTIKTIPRTIATDPIKHITLTLYPYLKMLSRYPKMIEENMKGVSMA